MLSGWVAYISFLCGNTRWDVVWDIFWDNYQDLLLINFFLFFVNNQKITTRCLTPIS